MTAQSRRRPGDGSDGLGRYIRWQAAHLTYRWAKRRRRRITQQLCAVAAEREQVLQVMARPRLMTQVHVLGAARLLEPIVERESALLARRWQMWGWLVGARRNALAVNRSARQGSN